MLKYLFAFLLGASTLAQADEALIEREDVKAYIAATAREQGFDEAELTQLFVRIEPRPRILEIFERPSTGRPWYEFRANFINPNRIRAGARFWQDNAELLAKIGKAYKVDPAVIVAILNAETLFGKNTGTFRVLDVLATSAFNHPSRADFFRKELTAFLLLARAEKQDPLGFKGSYAGAMGWPQFMPSSFRHFAIDWDGDGRHDIWTNTGDIVASVANYLARHGWQEEGSSHVAVNASGPEIETLLADKFNLHYTVAELMQKGVAPLTEPDLKQKAVLFALETEPGFTRHYLGFNNFYVVTRYNKSTLYATAVLELAEAIRTAWQGGDGALPASKPGTKAALKTGKKHQAQPRNIKKTAPTKQKPAQTKSHLKG